MNNKKRNIRKLNLGDAKLSKDQIDDFVITPIFMSHVFNGLEDMVNECKAFIEKNYTLFDVIIIKNNPLGRALHENLYPQYSFIMSIENEQTGKHSYWQNVTRLREPALIEAF